MLYLGRGTSFPLALEGALKLKEISYIHAEGYAAGELKHGPIALIDENMPVIVIAPHDRVFEKTVSNMQEVAARGGKIILMTDAKGAAEATIESQVTIVLPDMAATRQIIDLDNRQITVDMPGDGRLDCAASSACCPVMNATRPCAMLAGRTSHPP